MIKILLMILSLNFNLDIERSQYGVWFELVQQEALFPEISTQIAYCETKCGLTGVGKSKNNIFGFRGNGDYMSFKSIKECITYYRNWEDKNYPLFIEKTGKLDYYEFICWIGYKDGQRCSSRGRKYVNYIKKIRLNF